MKNEIEVGQDPSIKSIVFWQTKRKTDDVRRLLHRSRLVGNVALMARLLKLGMGL